MTGTPIGSIPRSTAPLALAVALALAGCGDGPTPDRVENLPPSVSITGGPPEGKRDSYLARVWWTGWDDDGFISHYEYALDPPPAFTSEEVNAPEASPGVSTRVLLGPAVGADTVRVGKTVDGVPYAFDYVQTRDFSRTFSLSTSHPDSGATGGSQVLPFNRFSGAHAIYLRARDNEGAYSDADRLGYTAESITPTAGITRPRTRQEYLTVGPQISIRWDGTDVDSPEPAKKPVAYIYKLVRLDRLSPPIGLLSAKNPDFIMHRAAAAIPWIRQSAESLGVDLYLESGGQYMFAVRAVDVAGAVEPFLDFTRGREPGNVFSFQAYKDGGSPNLTVSEPSLGTYTARGLGSVEYEVPAGQRLRFTWSAEAEAYGGTIEAYNFGVDVPDLSREGPNSGWVGWSTLTRNLDPVIFRKKGTHTVYVKARDVAGGETIIAVILRVIEFGFGREILVVDDYRDGTYPRDSEHDAFWSRILDGSGRFRPSDLLPEVVFFDAYGNGDTGFFNPIKPSLEDMGSYKLILFDTRAGGTGGQCALLLTAPISRHLGAYLAAGGKAWVSGEQTIAGMLPNETGLGNFNYPHEMLPGLFPWDFLKLYTGKIDNVGFENLDVHGMKGVIPFPGRPEIFPALGVDPAKQRAGFGGRYGIGGADLILEPVYAGLDPDFSGRIDSLYVYDTIGKSQNPPRSSVFDRRLCATRWSDADPGRTQGRVMWFGFPLYYMRDAQIQEMFNRAVDWFREESPAGP